MPIDPTAENCGIGLADHARAAIFALAVVEDDEAALAAITSGTPDRDLAPALATMPLGYLVGAFGVDGAARVLNGAISGFAARGLTFRTRLGGPCCHVQVGVPGCIHLQVSAAQRRRRVCQADMPPRPKHT